ncbi:MAG: type I-U CRISPR-associated helicase/endonuclease Cas3 [Parvibaculaceae bacterium]
MTSRPELIPFAPAFKALTGHDPMAWQRRLFDRLREGHLPEAVDLPTGLGKTAIMAIWLLARAYAAPDVTLPRRLIYVVDRRVVVDQATAEADKIAHALRPRQDSPLINDLRQRLGLREDQELPVCTLRGGLADDREWTYDPAAPAIVVCTVDMGGSRLLFSGYRLSRWSRSMQAGLMGADSLIVLDEAHIAPAFDAAARRVRDLCAETSDAAVPPMRFLPLSATLVVTGAKDVFGLEAEDDDDPLVLQRTGRSQPTKLVAFEALPSAKGALVDALAGRAATFDGKAQAVVVFCDRRTDAQAVAFKLRKQLAIARGAKEKELENHVALVTGARRGYERDKLVGEPTYRAFTYRNGERDLPRDERTRFLVCTAAGEVGADLDADAAVMDLVPLERMVQRLGRVNRRGEQAEPAPVTVYYDPAALKVSASEKNEEKKAEAARIAATKAVLEKLPRSAEDFDASPLHIGPVARDAREAASTPPPKIVPIERELVEAWALTSLKEHPGRPEVERFLHGIVEDEPQTTVAWRADVEHLAALPDRSVEDALAAARLMPAEVLEAPTREVVEVLQKRIKAFRKAWGKTQGDGGDAAEAPRLRALLFRSGKLVGRGEITVDDAVLEIWTIPTSGKKKTERVPFDGDTKDIQRALENATLLLPPVFGGLDEGGSLAADRGEREGEMHVQPDKEEERQWGVVIRLVGPANAEGKRDTELLTAPPRFLGEAGKEALREMSGPTRRRLRLRLAWSAKLPGPTEDEDGPTLEYWKHWDIDGETGASSRSQLLADHHDEAKAEMESLVQRLGLPAPLADALIRAMPVHDTGKSRTGWQDGVGAPRDGRPYAKSGGRGPGLRGYRHEFGSLRDALHKNTSVLGGLDDDLRDLALHAIASHHGRGRPTIPAADEEEFFAAVLEQDALDAALRYVRLQRRWGPWGLAWIEALFRSVDSTVSRRLDQRKDAAVVPAEEAAE